MRVRSVGRSLAHTLVAAGPVLTGLNTVGTVADTGSGAGWATGRPRPR